jgi:lipopolysaccharide export system protein LptA
MSRVRFLPLGPLLVLPFALAGSGSAIAQSKHDTAAPIDFDAAHIELQDRANRGQLSGNVVIRQAEMKLSADRVTVNYTGDISAGSPEVSRLDAVGDVTVTRPDQTAHAQYGVYDVGKRIITMVGGVTLMQGTNRVSGNRLSINLDTGRATIDGSGVANGTSGVTQSGGRVTGRFSVPKRAQ